MYCRNCGSRLADGADTCSNCGAEIPPDERTTPATMHPVSEPALVDDGLSATAGPFDGGRIDWTLRDVLFGALLFLGLFVVAPIPFVVPFLAFGEDSTPYYAAALIAGAGSELSLIGVAAWFTFRKYGGSWERLGFRRPDWSTLGYAVGALVAALLLSAAYGLLIEVFDIDALRSERDDQLPNEILDRNVLLAIAGVVVVGFAPICEETFFRGFIMPGMAKGWGIGVAMFTSALVFSLAHVGLNMHKTIVPILIIGVVLAFTYYRSRNLLASVGAHLMFNVLGFLLLVFSEPEDGEDAAEALGALLLRVIS